MRYFDFTQHRLHNETTRDTAHGARRTNKGFSLVELILVISIIAVMSVGAYVGFRGTGDTLQAREAGGIITDTVKIAEMEIINDDYVKNTIHFLDDYLVIISEPQDKSLELTLGSSCAGGHNILSNSSGNLVKKGRDGNSIESKTVTNTYTECIVFKDSAEVGWNYQISSSGEVSDVIRFLHFNVNRPNSNIEIKSGGGANMIIEAPYGKKTLSVSPISLTLSSGDAEETITIQ